MRETRGLDLLAGFATSRKSFKTRSCADRGRRLAAARKKAPGKYAGSVLEIGRLAAFESVKWTAEKRGRVETRRNVGKVLFAGAFDPAPAFGDHSPAMFLPHWKPGPTEKRIVLPSFSRSLKK